MLRRPYLVLSALAFALALGVGWLVRTITVDDQPGVASKSPTTHVEKPSAEHSDGSQTPITSSNAGGLSSTRAAADVDESIMRSTSAASDAELADAVWVEGRVRIPDGTPADEHAEVIADGWAFDSRSLYRAPIEADGRFRVAFSKVTKRGKLRVEGRYLYLPEPFALKLPELPPDIVLEPVVGGCIKGRLILPPSAIAMAKVVRAAGVKIERCSSHEGYSMLGRESKVTTNDNLEFEIDHLSTGSCWSIRARLSGFVPIERGDLHLKAGAIERLELELRLGARITGQVQDEDGVAIEDVRFESERDASFEWKSDDLSSIRSAADGSFDCAGLFPGKISLRAKKEGYVSATYEAGLLAEGAVKSDVVIVLRLGKCLVGRVRWPDGMPAASCRIELHASPVEGSQWRESPEDRHATTEDDGSFKITGLEKGPFAITARSDPEPKREQVEASSSTAELPETGAGEDADDEWSARLDDVEPSSNELMLVLQPGKKIQGRVVDDTGHPIEHFALEIHPIDETGRATGSGGFDFKSFQDPNGLFRLSGLHDGAWRINVRAKGFALAHPRTFKLPGEMHLTDIVLPRGASISGSVVDPDGNPVAKASLRIERAWDGSGADSRSNSAWDPSTDGSGHFVWSDLSPGSLQLCASAAGWTDSAPLNVDLAPAQTVNGLVITMRSGGRLSGEVFDSSGKPDANRAMWLNTSGPPVSSKRFAADPSGRIDVEHLVPGVYSVQTIPNEKEEGASQSGREDQHATSMRWARVIIVEGETTHITIGAPPIAPVRVHGVVTSAHAPVAGMRLSINGRLSGGEGVHHSTTSDAQGRYELVLDEPGNWSFFLALPSGTSSGRHEDIPKVPSYELDIALPSGTITGRVVDPNGQPIAGVFVSLSTDPGTAELSSVGVGGSTTSDSGGRFQFDSLPAAIYALGTEGITRSSSGGPSLYGKLHKGGLVLEEGGALTDVELRLTKAGRIGGIVLGPDGSPAPNAAVFVRELQAGIVSSRGSAITDPKGHFEVSGLSPGAVTVFARTEALCSTESAPVTVRSDDSAEVELTLQPSAMLRVIVENEHGEKIGSMISVVDGGGRDYGPTNPATDDDMSAEGQSLGRKFGPLPPGTYAIRATNHDRTSVGAQATASAGEQKLVTLHFGG